MPQRWTAADSRNKVRLVETHAEQMFDLGSRRPMPPTRREIGDARHVGEGDNAAVVGADAGLALSLEREPAIGSGMWRAADADASMLRRDGSAVTPLARVRGSFPRGQPRAWSAGDFAAYTPDARYRSKWYIDDSDGSLLSSLGIHRQYLFVDVERQLVVAKVSPQELPLRITATFRVVSAARRTPAG
jgi:hypothetical protein